MRARDRRRSRPRDEPDEIRAPKQVAARLQGRPHSNLYGAASDGTERALVHTSNFRPGRAERASDVFAIDDENAARFPDRPLSHRSYQEVEHDQRMAHKWPSVCACRAPSGPGIHRARARERKLAESSPPWRKLIGIGIWHRIETAGPMRSSYVGRAPPTCVRPTAEWTVGTFV